MKPTEIQLKGIENILKMIQTLSHDTNTQPLRELVFIIINEDLSNVKKDAVNVALDKFRDNIITFDETLLFIQAIIESNDVAITVPYTPPSTTTPNQPWTEPWVPSIPNQPSVPGYPWITYFNTTSATSKTRDSGPDIYTYNNRSITNQYD